MRYAILCYHDEAEVESWPKAKDDAVLAKRHVVTDRLAKQGKLGPVARLMPTTAATTVRQSDPFIVDGPFAETKEQLLGFYIVECDTLEEAIAIASEMGKDETGGFEVRPLRIFEPGGPMPKATMAKSAKEPA